MVSPPVVQSPAGLRSKTHEDSPKIPMSSFPSYLPQCGSGVSLGSSSREDLARPANLAFRPKENASKETLSSATWVVFCNNCSKSMEDVHFHCSICDNGDYDLCQKCVEGGVHCPGTDHWMVKRFVRQGIVVNSTTEKVGPMPKPETEQEMPGAFTEERKSVEFEPEEPTRTCNSCVKGKCHNRNTTGFLKLTFAVLPEKDFVTCITCEDYDLCMECHLSNKHGHHPGHVFEGATGETPLSPLASILCNAGRNVRHCAVCDGCEKVSKFTSLRSRLFLTPCQFIYGVRHKCLNCPDWDFCSECIKSAKFIHPRHRFVPIYEPLAEPNTSAVRHYGIYCDGPLCKDKENVSYIEGVRYKCAVCNDTDFCANCEAIPTNRHNRTHPLIKFKPPVRSVSVTTLGEDKNGVAFAPMGDQPARKSTATETVPVSAPVNAATQVQTIVDLKPSEEAQPKPTSEKIQIRDLLSEPVQQIKIQDLLSAPLTSVAQEEPAKSEAISIPKAEPTKPSDDLDAHFVRDTISDGTKVVAESEFVQVWTLRNPGPNAWPAGCSVRYVGGDNMLNLDNNKPFSHAELAEASESNVIGRPVLEGEDIAFRVVLKAPKREGTAISYWRLKTADGTPFGHRLWCDIQVIPPPAPASQSPDPQPAALSSDVPESSTSVFKQRAQSRLEMKRILETRARNYLAKKNLQKEPVDAQARRSSFEEAERAKLSQRIDARRKAVERIVEAQRSSMSTLSQNAGPSSQDALAEHERLRRFFLQALAKPTTDMAYNEAPVAQPEAPQAEVPATEPEVPEPQAEAPAPKVEESKEEVQQEKEVVEEAPVEESTQTEVASEPKPESSTMIFPTLEKESPASSTHEAAAVSAPQETTSDARAPVAPSEGGETEFFEDAESVEVLSASSDDDASFLTDEEYDILDASDEEMP